jgi:hypothetical protein
MEIRNVLRFREKNEKFKIRNKHTVAKRQLYKVYMVLGDKKRTRDVVFGKHSRSEWKK